MNTYLLINIAIIVFPLAFSFHKRISYYRKLPAVLASILAVGVFYVAWDVYVTGRGDWAFNEGHVLGVKLLGLPVEELLFFVTAPYSCLFVYESIKSFINERRLAYDDRILLLASALLLAASLMSLQKEYTSLVLAVTGLVFLGLRLFFRDIAHSFRYWLYIAVTFILFFVFNYLLTSIPVVSYNPDAISGLRVSSIPIEDFFYNFSLLTMSLMAYLEASRMLRT